ncbi:hypothetical protein CPC735_004590 [Coccidioides posadasii C735 delta SOWgp]|uniref:Zn(2)-C6 fungal-type domain-containing protein n=1 Tax=Coccidioides posadasii (strain C735) TaxID=222929 RepID=C5P976_COCP7|nr:hypothetical protein CPC735_004590 [Coccidioides posadasii C735 delta SOWgp]EER26288.1 hypothetical protein CPC735_004590 [Coccidioides posadasii C735 delta SOWgp]|eukprot:XP_003068433.1 hypothetical protein CPC735_004590 [Coccidioides posadasii C735 delta SOWgp]
MPSEGVPKCQRCRRDHKKCSPDNRPWPGPKCDRCENYGYECSENMMARRSSQKDIDPARTPGCLIESMPHAKFYYQSVVTQALPMGPQPQTSNVISRPVSTPSPWVGLFEYLRYIDWQNMKCFRVYPDPFAAIFRSSSCPVPDLSDTPLGRRQMYLEIFLEHQRLMHNTTSLEASINFFVNQLQRRHPRIATAYSPEELSGICASHIRYGSYWHVLRSELQTDEILLIDPNYSFDAEIPKITFESAKQFWLSQHLGLRQFCQKLSGLSQMISDLARTDPNSEERAFLATKIPDRLEEVLGPRISPFGEPIRMCAPSFFPIDVLTSSPMETTDADVYSPSDSAGAEESDDGYALGDRAYQAILGNSYFSENDLWGQ